MRTSYTILPRRRIAIACGLAALGLTGCNKPVRPASQALACEVPATPPINRKFLFDRTTLPTDTMIDQLVPRLQGSLRPGDHLQVISFGGVTPSLVEESVRIAVPASPPETARQRELLRWSASPDQIKRLKECSAHHTQSNAAAQLRAVLMSSDSSVQARSPIVEAIAAAVGSWRGNSLEVWSDGIEHLGGERTFYGSGHGLNLPEPSAWIEQLRRDRLLPSLKGVQVTHMAIGLSEAQGTGAARGLRPYSQVLELKQLWAAYWDATGATCRFGEPLPLDDA